MSARYEKGFTIVEMLVVIAIIGILVGLVSVAVGGSMKNGRAKRATAMGNVLQQSIAMYYTKTGKWPDVIENRANNMSGDKDTYTFTASETDSVFREIVEKSTGQGATMALVDASALFVANEEQMKSADGCFGNHSDSSLDTYCGNKKCVNGTDFSRASKKGRGNIPLNKMVFGYQATGTGKFCRFWITYNSKTDSVTVSRKHPEKTYPEDWE